MFVLNLRIHSTPGKISPFLHCIPPPHLLVKTRKDKKLNGLALLMTDPPLTGSVKDNNRQDSGSVKQGTKFRPNGLKRWIGLHQGRIRCGNKEPMFLFTNKTQERFASLKTKGLIFLGLLRRLLPCCLLPSPLPLLPSSQGPWPSELWPPPPAYIQKDMGRKGSVYEKPLSFSGESLRDILNWSIICTSQPRRWSWYLKSAFFAFFLARPARCSFWRL